jgi:hypothetical protein
MPPEPKLLPLITRILARQGADPELLPAMAAALADELGPHATLATAAWSIQNLLEEHPEYKAPPAAEKPAPAATLQQIQPGMKPATRRAVTAAIAPALVDLNQQPAPPDHTGPPVDLADIHKGMSEQQKEDTRNAIARALE